MDDEHQSKASRPAQLEVELMQARGFVGARVDAGVKPRGVQATKRWLFYATRSGGVTLDLGEGGGNPFASALIELADEPTWDLRDLPLRLRKLTMEKSQGRQIPECDGPSRLPKWRFQDEGVVRKERRTALVLVVADYSASRPGASLVGAARDERRIAAMCAQHGFSVTQGIAPDRHSLLQALRTFKRTSCGADVSVIYSTGHGYESDGEVYLVPGDYPFDQGMSAAQLKRRALAVSRIARSACARELNLVFFAGCRQHVVEPRVGVHPPLPGRTR